MNQGKAPAAAAPDKSMSRRWSYLLMGFVAMLFAGVIYAWSILKAPLAIEFGWTASQLSLNYTLTMAAFCIGGLGASFIARKVNPKKLILCAAPVIFVGFFLASRISGNTLWLLYLSYGIIAGIGIGIAYNAIISTVSRWYPDKKGLCSGVLMMGFGASTLLLGNLADQIIAVPSLGWRSAYVIMGAAAGIVVLVAGILLRMPSAENKLPTVASGSASAAVRDYTTGEMLRTSSFWKYFIFNILLSAVGSTTISFAKDISISVGTAATTATVLVGVLAVCNGLGRIFCGLLFDHLGRRKTMLLGGAINLAAPIIVLLSVLATASVPCILGMCLCGIAYGFSPTLGPAFASQFFGQKYFSSNLGICTLALAPAALTATLCGSLITKTGSYVQPFILLTVFAVISLAFNLSIRDPK